MGMRTTQVAPLLKNSRVEKEAGSGRGNERFEHDSQVSTGTSGDIALRKGGKQYARGKNAKRKWGSAA